MNAYSHVASDSHDSHDSRDSVSPVVITEDDALTLKFHVWDSLRADPDRLAYAKDLLRGEFDGDGQANLSDRVRGLIREFLADAELVADFGPVTVEALEAVDSELLIGTAVQIFAMESARLRLTA